MFGALLVETISAETAPAVQHALGERGLVIPAADGPEALLLEAGGGRVAGFSTISPDKPEDNQDAGLVLELDTDTTLLAVADGAGGIRGGRRASRIALSTLRDSVLYADRESTPLRDIVVAAFEQANLAVIQATRGAATTLTAAIIESRVVQIFHVGDSIGLVTGQRSRVKMQTVAHSPVGFAIAAGYLTEEQAIFHPERHIVSNFVGTHEMLIEVGPKIKMAARDRVLLASDGLTDNLYLEEILSVMRSGPLDDAVGDLALRASERMYRREPTEPGKPDDIVALLFDKRP
ncbi:MAG: protein phosphatase 2C domain-containing protein [Pseudomonadota bacterium]